MSGFIDKCRSHLTDTHPENDETHATTRYAAMYPPELPLQPELPPAQDTLEQKFAEFDKAHPEVFVAICETARSMKYEQIFSNVKIPRLSMKGIFESIRGKFGHLRLNNSYTSFYTDKLIEKYPEYEDNFERRARAKGKMKRVYAK